MRIQSCFIFFLPDIHIAVFVFLFKYAHVYACMIPNLSFCSAASLLAPTDGFTYSLAWLHLALFVSPNASVWALQFMHNEPHNTHHPPTLTMSFVDTLQQLNDEQDLLYIALQQWTNYLHGNCCRCLHNSPHIDKLISTLSLDDALTDVMQWFLLISFWEWPQC